MSRSNRRPKESPSRKLRGVFYKLWEKKNEGFKEFEPYYESKMKKLITYYKKMI